MQNLERPYYICTYVCFFCSILGMEATSVNSQTNSSPSITSMMRALSNKQPSSTIPSAAPATTEQSFAAPGESEPRYHLDLNPIFEPCLVLPF